MTKCLSCGHLRHDLELNCPHCGSFYSMILNDFMESEQPPKAPVKLTAKIKKHLAHPKNHKFAIGAVIFLIILLGIFL